MQEFQSLFQAELANLNEDDRRIAKTLPKMARAIHAGHKRSGTHQSQSERPESSFLMGSPYENAMTSA
jgi:hypothetical protein